MKSLLKVLLCVMCIFIGAESHAALITGVHISEGSEELSGDADFSIQHLIDESGLSAGKHALTEYAISHGNSWLTRYAAPAFVIFDLGNLYDLLSLQVWNLNFAGFLDLGAEHVTISISSDYETWDVVWDSVFTAASGSSNYAGFTIDASAWGLAQYVRFDILDNFGGSYTIKNANEEIVKNYGQLVGLSEVQFYSTPVPEPATFALLGAGLAGVCLLHSRRNRG